MIKKHANRTWYIQTDGAIRPDQSASGLSAIVRNAQGEIDRWWNRPAGAMTCNEAEYAAVIFALEKTLSLPVHKRPIELIVLTDSQILVDQMVGNANAKAPGLRAARDHLRKLTTQFKRVSFQHIPREQNRLADALAYEALAGFTAWSAQSPRYEQRDLLQALLDFEYDL